MAAIRERCNADALGLKVFKCPWNIQKAFETTADNCDGSSSELCKVCADVHSALSAPVNAPQTTSCKDFDACEACQEHSSRDSCATIQFATGNSLCRPTKKTVSDGYAETKAEGGLPSHRYRLYLSLKVFSYLVSPPKQ